MTIDKDGNEVMRRFVTNGDGLRNAADAAAGGNIGDFDELKDYFYEGKLGDGTRLKIELNPDGHANTNEGPHVKIQIWDPEKTGKSKSKLGGWRTTEKHFIEGREHFKEEYDWKTEMKKWEEENNGSN